MDAMSGRGELEDRGLVADFYGLGERAEYRSKQTEADGADSRADGADWGGLGNWRTQRTTESWTGRMGQIGPDRADSWTGGRADYGIVDRADWGGLERTGRRGAYWVELGGT